MPTARNSYTNHRRQTAGLPVQYDPVSASRNYSPNFTIKGTPSAGAAQTAANAVGTASTLKNWWSRAFPNAKAGFKNTFGGGVNGAGLSLAPEGFDWSSKGGLKAFGKNIGTGANVLSGVMQGVDFAQGVDNYMDTLDSNEDLKSKIDIAAMGNPLLSSYLTSDQLDLLGDLQLGNYDGTADAGDFLKGAVGGLGNAIVPTLAGFATGGIPGAVIGGVGTLINSGVDNLSNASGQSTAELQALYQALQDAEMQYKAMKRPNFTGLGIQQQYQNMYA